MRDYIGYPVYYSKDVLLGKVTNQFKEEGRDFVVIDDNYEAEVQGEFINLSNRNLPPFHIRVY